MVMIWKTIEESVAASVYKRYNIFFDSLINRKSLLVVGLNALTFENAAAAGQRLCRRRSAGALSNRRLHDDRTIDHQSPFAGRHLLSPRYVIFFFILAYRYNDGYTWDDIPAGASGDCNAAACLSALGHRNNGSLSTARLGRYCQCQCPIERPIYREDLKQCVSTIDGIYIQ